MAVAYESPFEYLSTDGSDLSGVTKTLELPETAEAPIKKGAAAGKAVYTLNGTEIGIVPILYTDNVDAATYRDYFVKALHCLLL